MVFWIMSWLHLFQSSVQSSYFSSGWQTTEKEITWETVTFALALNSSLHYQYHFRGKLKCCLDLDFLKKWTACWQLWLNVMFPVATCTVFRLQSKTLLSATSKISWHIDIFFCLKLVHTIPERLQRQAVRYCIECRSSWPYVLL
jgi:hypothetical protein